MDHSAETRQRIEQVARECVRRRFELWHPSHPITVAPVSDQIYIGYSSGQKSVLSRIDSTHLDFNIVDGVFYLTSIGLDKQFRGRGLGWQLYEASEEIARILGYPLIRTTPSGWTPSGKTRKQYLLERGYKPFGDVEVEKILQ